MKAYFAFLFALLYSTTGLGTANTTQVQATSYSAHNVTTSAYYEVSASSPISVSKLQICDTSTKVIKVATGAAGSETDICTNQVSGCVVVPYYIPAGTRISIKAIDATASSGYNVIGFIP